MECGENFWGLFEEYADEVTFADPDGPWYTPLGLAILDWRAANAKMTTATATLVGKIAALDPERAMVDAEIWDELQALVAWNATASTERPTQGPNRVDWQTALAQEVAAAKQICCLYSKVNDELAALSQLEALPDQPSKSKPGVGVGFAQGAGLGLGLLLILFLFSRSRD